MVQVSIPESPVQHVLPSGDSVSVPAGEIWKVTIALGVRGSSGTTYSADINGVTALYTNAGNGNNGSVNTGYSIETVLTGGDTVSAGSSGTVYVSGFEISSLVDNTPVVETVGSGSSFTVPSGETWFVDIAMTGGASLNTIYEVEINGTDFMAYSAGSNNDGAAESGYQVEDVVLSGGDTISTSSGATAIITGFRVDQ